ncbi:Spx/MgsR family RNA polymerase-binding regulatory protein [Enterococcus gilvus]|uniref:Spx/MgsR family RNA polymerase-binding regulatory protein n=1 Tax=Enterococcus gilvus TaxID=160453 RepID=UPI0009148B2D|nr:Spx/MgsR family RNA polymerase-binding regulatory protein [Enterococcus gilvus]OJG41119.1 spx/MgsR family transcriptional regulator [Enterococcus gilvus]
MFVQKSHVSCKKLLNWLDEQGVNYEKRYIDEVPLSEKELLNILSFTENGFEEILSTRSLKNQLNLTESDIEPLSVKQLVALMVKNPSLIKRPFVIRGEKLYIGYDKDQVYTLIPKDVRYKKRNEFRYVSKT